MAQPSIAFLNVSGSVVATAATSAAGPPLMVAQGGAVKFSTFDQNCASPKPAAAIRVTPPASSSSATLATQNDVCQPGVLPISAG